MEGVSATLSSGLIFGVDFSRSKQAHFFYTAGEVGAEAERGQLEQTLFHFSPALLILDTLAQHNATGRVYGPLSIKRESETWPCNCLISPLLAKKTISNALQLSLKNRFLNVNKYNRITRYSSVNCVLSL